MVVPDPAPEGQPVFRTRRTLFLSVGEILQAV